MNDELAFLELIAENPDELGPRLRYADFLDDRRDAVSTTRAEFIRVQCALDHLPENDPSFEKLQSREQKLLGANWQLWMRPICQALGEPPPIQPVKRTWGEWLRRKLRNRQPPTGPRLDLLWTDGPRPNHIITHSPVRRAPGNQYLAYARFAAGFVSEVSLRASLSRDKFYLDRLFERTPVIDLTLHQFDGRTMRHLIHKGWLRRLRILDLFGPDSDILLELIHAPDAAVLRSFGLYYAPQEVDDVSWLLAQATTLQPERVGLHHLRLSDMALDDLAGSPFMARTAHLILEGINLPERALIRLLERTRIRHLELIGPVGLRMKEQMGARLRERFPGVNISARGHVRA